MVDRKFIRRFKRWLKPFWGQRPDCAYQTDTSWDQWTDAERETFRNYSGVYSVMRSVTGRRSGQTVKYRKKASAFTPRFSEFGSHFNGDDPFTIFLMNSSSSDGLIPLLLDIDDKRGDGDADGAVRHLLANYGLTTAYVEPSRGGHGRHVYVLLDVSLTGAENWGARRDVWETIDRWADVLRSDPIWHQRGVKFDRIQGGPTLWARDAENRFRIDRRGSTVKLPTCPNGIADLIRLESMVPVRLERLQDRLGIVIPRTASQSRSVVAPDKAQLDLTQMDGFQKKAKLISRLLIASDGHATVEQVCAEYLSCWEPSTVGDTPKQERERTRIIRTMLKNMKKRFRPRSDTRLYPFKRDQFLPVIRALDIPPTDYQWSRREKLTERRLSDFVSLMVGNAFFKGEGDRFGQTCRNTTVENSRRLKASGTIDWTLNNSTYRKLLDIAVKHRLLSVEQEHVRPVIDAGTQRKLVKGKARVIAPGHALTDVRNAWLPLWNRWRGTRGLGQHVQQVA